MSPASRPGVRDVLAGLSPIRVVRELRDEFDPVILVLAAGDLISNFGFALVFPFLSLYLTSALGATPFQAGLLLGVYAVCRVVSNSVGGWLADRVGRRSVMVGSVVGTTIFLVAMSQASRVEVTGLLLIGLGLFDPAFVPAARATVADVVPEDRRPRAYSLLAVAQNVGWIAGPAIGAGLAAIGYSVLFLVAAVAVGAYAILLLRFVRETKPSAADGTRTRQRATGFSGGELPYVRASDVAARADAAAEARNNVRVFAAFITLVFVLHVAEAQWFTTLPVYGVETLGLTAIDWGVLFAFNGVLIVGLQLPLTRVMERHATLNVVAIGAILTAVAYGLVLLIPGPAQSLLFLAGVMVLITFGEIIFLPMLPNFASSLAPRAERGRYQGTLEASVAAGAVLGPPLGGYILQSGLGNLLWIGSALVCVGCAAGFWILGVGADRLEVEPSTSGGATA
jgi:MFS family permease